MAAELCPGLGWHWELYLNVRANWAEGLRLHANNPDAWR